jgi:ferritin heavy chain
VCLQYLYNLHEVADKNGDGQMADFVEVMLDEQVHGVKECADYVAKLRRVGKGLGVYMMDDVSNSPEHGKGQSW